MSISNRWQAKLEKTWIVGGRKCRIPDYMHEGIIDYLDRHISPGGFLTAVLENDLLKSYERADLVNQDAIPAYISFLYNYAPMESWGSPEKVKAWLNKEVIR